MSSFGSKIRNQVHLPRISDTSYAKNFIQDLSADFSLRHFSLEIKRIANALAHYIFVLIHFRLVKTFGVRMYVWLGAVWGLVLSFILFAND